MKKTMFIFSVFLFASLIMAVSLGAADISVMDSLKIIISRLPFAREIAGDNITKTQVYIVCNVRVPRALLAGLVGAALSVVGAVFQGIFQNPLADPHILGVSSGAALGATIGLICSANISISIIGIGTMGVCAFLGAMLSIVLIFFITNGVRCTSMTAFILVGTAINTMLSAVVSLIMSLNRDNMQKIYMWTMGSFSSANWQKIGYVFVVIVVCYIVIRIYAYELNIISMGDEHAKSLGVNVAGIRKKTIIIASLLVAVSVSVSGIIGFIGLVVPHCVRYFTGNDYRKLLPSCLICGAAFTIVCDTVSRILIAPTELPVGVITSIIGGAYFIVLLKRRNKETN